MHFTKLAYQKQIRTLQENYSPISLTMASQMVLEVKEPTCQCRRCKRHSFDPQIGKILWRRTWQPTPVFLPENSMDNGSQRAILHRVAESGTTKELSMHTRITEKHRCENSQQNTSKLILRAHQKDHTSGSRRIHLWDAILSHMQINESYVPL